MQFDSVLKLNEDLKKENEMQSVKLLELEQTIQKIEQAKHEG